jgi:hypothetical protein
MPALDELQPTDRVELNYIPTIDDYIEFSVFAVRRLRKRGRSGFLRNFALCAIIGLLLVAIYNLAGQPPTLARILDLWPAVIAIGCVLLLFGSSWLTRRSARRRYRDGSFAQLFLAKRFEASSDGFRWSDELTEWSARWAAVYEIGVAGEGIFLFSNSISACVVPRHAFASEAEFRGCVDRLRAWFEAGRRGTADKRP